MVKIRFRKNVYLTKSEYDELLKLYGQTAVDYIERLSNHITATNKKYSSHFETLKEWLNKDQVAPSVVIKGKTEPRPEDDTILEYLREKYHYVHCKCGKRMEFVDFVEKIEGKVPDGRYKCSCGITAQEKEGKLIYGN